MSFEEDQPGEPATIPPPGDPDKAWRSAFMAEVQEVRDEVKELRAEVKELARLVRVLNSTVQDCVTQVLSYAAETEQLKTRLSIVEARVTINPPPTHANG